MPLNALTSGVGGTTGPSLVTAAPLYQLSATHSTWYVGPGGTDGAAPAGWQREKPLLTLGQAVTNANSGDIIVLLENFTESIAVGITIADTDLTIVSEGDGSSRARLTCSGAGINMLDVTGAGTYFSNIVFPASTAAGSIRIRTAAAGTVIEDCVFEAGASDTSATVGLIAGWGNARIAGCTFTVTATGARPGIRVSNAGSRLTMQDVSFNAGSAGWDTYAFDGLAAVTGLRALDIDQLNGSDVNLAANTTGWWIPGSCTGGSILFGA